MDNISVLKTKNEKHWFKIAAFLAVLTIIYNITEGIISIYFGLEDEALTLFGFGVDSFIETISAVGIFTMIFRLRASAGENRSQFEMTALRVTGWGFYFLAVGLSTGAVLSLLEKHSPQTTLPGFIISIISISGMWLLIHYKRKTGKALNSDAILADANCNLVCVYMSLVLLISSLLFELTGYGWFDALGAAGLVWFSISEGREAFEKAKGHACNCHTCKT